MNTARRIRDDISGFSGPGTLYQIDPPLDGTEFVILFYQPPMFGQQGKLNVILATEDGNVRGTDVRPQEGTYVTRTPDHALAFQLAGGYQIVESEETGDEPGLEG